ncbi:MAG: glycosyl hydrolase [Ectothiorhodospiraceae bacterium]|nr:glycosyl hydrolase [Ectothiorhodospiraceae bacterium]
MRFTITLLLISCIPAFGQVRNVQLSSPNSTPEEVTIAINPANPDNMIAGANIRYHYWSFDGGRTWEAGLLPANTFGDPCVAFDADGRGYFAHLSRTYESIIVRYSDDGGINWSDGTQVFGPSSDDARPGGLTNSSLQDKEWLTVDRTGGQHHGNVYMTWTDFTLYGSENPEDSSVIVFARSLDRGETFDPYVRISDIAGNAADGDNTMEGAVPSVGPNGEIYVCWAGPDGLYFDKSTDAGETWGEDKVIADNPGGWAFDISGIYRSNGLPVTAVDFSSSPHRGTVYVNWIDWRHGDPDVFLLRSTDQGATWSEPLRVNDDEIGNGKEQFFTWMTVDEVTGEVCIVFYDRRAYRTDSTDVYLARSTDGGKTFTNERISEAAFFPQAFIFFGDYNNIAAYAGTIRPIWTELNAGRLSIHTAILEEPTSVDRTGNRPESIYLHSIYPNPARKGDELQLKLDRISAGRLQINVYDPLGRLLHTQSEWGNSGKTTVPLQLPSELSGAIFIQIAGRSTGGTMTQVSFTRPAVILD